MSIKIILELMDLYKQTSWKQVEDSPVSWGLTVTKHGELSLMFRETVGKEGWMSNFRFTRTPYSNMVGSFKVHTGFLELYKSIREEVLSACEQTSGDTPILLFGYSQGGAVAQIAAEDIQYHMHVENRIPETNVWTYALGAPRVFGWRRPKYAQGINLLEMAGDIVTWVPPWLFGYRKAGNTYRIPNKFKPGPDSHGFENYREALEQL